MSAIEYIEGVSSWRSTGGLHSFKQIKGSDEFYTYYKDIESELALYPVEQFFGKHVWCPCDSPSSNFTLYFRDNFERLGLKHLTSTCLDGQRLDYDGVNESITTLDNGDMFGDCVADLWIQADIVVTNPPFSRKFEFLAKLLKFNKKFLVLNMNTFAASFDCGQAIVAGQLWMGQTSPIKFMRPDGSPRGNRVRTMWFTNLKLDKKLRPLPLSKSYDPATAEWIDGGWDGEPLLNVNRIKDIPIDYYSPIACPIGVLTDCYDMSGWTVLGVVVRHWGVLPPHATANYRSTARVNGIPKFCRVAIQRCLD